MSLEGEEEEEDEPVAPSEGEGDTASQDIFADSQDYMENPLLAAKSRRSASVLFPSSNTKGEARNPFAKKSVNNQGTGV